MSELCISLFSYTATKPDEMKLVPGQIIKIMKKADDGWNFGASLADQAHGWFPSNFVAIPQDLDLSQASVGQLRYGRVLFDYSPQEPDELQLRQGDHLTIINTQEDDGWHRGILHGKLGVFPENFVKIVADLSSEERAPYALNKAKAIIPGNRRSSLAVNAHLKVQQDEAQQQQVLSTVIVTFDYSSQQSDELQLKKGQTLEVLAKQDDGWWTGRDQTGKVGVFPFNFVRELMSTEERTNLSAASKPLFESKGSSGSLTRLAGKIAIDTLTKKSTSELNKSKNAPPVLSPKPAVVIPQTPPKPALNQKSSGEPVEVINKLAPLTKNRVSLQGRKRAPSFGVKGTVQEPNIPKASVNQNGYKQEDISKLPSKDHTLFAQQDVSPSQDVTLYQVPEPIVSVQQQPTVRLPSYKAPVDSENVTMIEEAVLMQPSADNYQDDSNTDFNNHDYILNYASNISLNNNGSKTMSGGNVSKHIAHSEDNTLYFGEPQSAVSGQASSKDKNTEFQDIPSKIRDFINMELANLRVDIERQLTEEREKRSQLEKQVTALKKLVDQR